MRAIVTNVNPKSSFANCNGLTFEVKEVLTTLVALNVPDECGKIRAVDFTHKEVFIVDIQEELQQAYDDKNWGSDYNTYASLEKYCETKGIKLKVKYNCPA